MTLIEVDLIFKSDPHPSMMRPYKLLFGGSWEDADWGNKQLQMDEAAEKSEEIYYYFNS